jgi:hypothetical protein
LVCLIEAWSFGPKCKGNASAMPLCDVLIEQSVFDGLRDSSRRVTQRSPSPPLQIGARERRGVSLTHAHVTLLLAQEMQSRHSYARN